MRRRTPTCTTRGIRMLVLSRKKNQQLVLRMGDETVVLRVLEVTRDRVRVGIIAPPSVAVHREEVARRIQEWQGDLDALLAGEVPAEPVA